MIIVTNASDNDITRAAVTFKPGENKFKTGELSDTCLLYTSDAADE